MPDLTGVVLRWFSFGATVLIGGMALSPWIHGRPSRLLGRLPGLGGLLLVTAVIGLWRQATAFAGEGGVAGTIPLLLATPWGWAWVAQVVAAAMLVLPLGRRPGGTRLAALVLVMVPSLQGHAIGSERFTTLAVGADMVHMAAAALWIGSLAVLLLDAGSSDDPSQVAAAVKHFSPWAMVGVGALGATGVLGGWLHVGSIEALTTTTYGRVLLLKVLVVGGVLVLGAINWRWMSARLALPRGVARFRRSAVFEVMVAWLVLGLTAVLVATALPGE